MMNLQTFLLLLLIISTFTSLAVEGIKVLLEERQKSYYANTLAAVVSVVMSAVVGAAYIIIIDAQLTASMMIYLIALVFLSWLCSMVGYDKVIQAISQFKIKEDKDE